MAPHSRPSWKKIEFYVDQNWWNSPCVTLGWQEKKIEKKIMIFRNFFIVYIFTLKNQFVQKRRGSQSFGAKTGPGLSRALLFQSYFINFYPENPKTGFSIFLTKILHFWDTYRVKSIWNDHTSSYFSFVIIFLDMQHEIIHPWSENHLIQLIGAWV